MIVYSMKRANGDVAFVRTIGNMYAADVTTHSGRNDNSNWPEVYDTAVACKEALEKWGFKNVEVDECDATEDVSKVKQEEKKKMKKAAVITKVSINGETYIAYYESGKSVVGKIENMPGTVKKWLEENTETVEPHNETITAPVTMEVTTEEIKAAFTGVSVIDTETGETITEDAAEVAATEKPESMPAAYLSIEIDRDDILAITREGIEAAAFAGAAALRMFTCIGLVVCWIGRRIKAGYQAVVNTILFGITVVWDTVFGWLGTAVKVASDIWEFVAALYTEVENFLAPIFWGILDAASKAWAFREELVKEGGQA